MDETTTKIVIINYSNSEIRIIPPNKINYHILETAHDNDIESYITEEEGYKNNESDYMVTDDLTIIFD